MRRTLLFTALLLLLTGCGTSRRAVVDQPRQAPVQSAPAITQPVNPVTIPGEGDALPYLAAELPAGIPVEELAQRRISVAAGEYSGIARVSGDVYAVVHDKGKGGGLYSFTIPIGTNGVLGAVSAFEMDANAGGEAGRDNEDVVYVPETGTLFVSAEGDQSIREYDLSGKSTGRALAIPADLGSDHIQPNGGFEALAYSDGAFWTMPEMPTRDRLLYRNLIPLQRFRLQDLQPDGRYYYPLSTPQIASSEGASAYVHGVSAMTALPDGRLLVLEREVYVPGGSMLEKALNSFTLNSIFVIDPLHDRTDVLQKRLLHRFATTAVNIANFEGMCLGPELQGGIQTLLLIADSQGGKDGLTGEYLKVIAFKL